MSTFDTLPIMLVSAINETAATRLISELIDNDVTDDYLKDTQSLDRVWRMVNKYYTVNVRVHVLTDLGRLEVNSDAIEAHVIHITEEELTDGAVAVARAEARAAGAGGAWRRAAVRLLLADAARAPAALGAWAASQRAAALGMRAAAERAPGPFAQGSGPQRARAALHAHAWRGLVRTDRGARPPLPETTAGSESSAGSDESDSEAEELRAVEQAEAFAAALGALGPALEARQATGGAPGLDGPPELRREQAEALVLAFCRALGLDPAAC